MPLKWSLDDGWVSSPSSELLLWLPPTNRQVLWAWHTKLVMGRSQNLIMSPNFVHGPEWKKCYIRERSS
ncbi:hypothetical protein B0H11DRAFT_1990635 [Mycena galericulata]|nr:hypothetical protein B0H11DRAFT_2293884 [Mycena galericulata]KAJ7502127.1 hypothetical protein B0H11DRAFT_1990635 [Mycena galericulata]